MRTGFSFFGREGVIHWLRMGFRTPPGRTSVLLSLLMMSAFAAGYLYIEMSTFAQMKKNDRERNARNAEISLLTESLFLLEQSFDAAQDILFFGSWLEKGNFPRSKLESHINVELLAAEQANHAMRRFLEGRGSALHPGIRNDIAGAVAAHNAAAQRVQAILRAAAKPGGQAGAENLLDARDSLRRLHDELLGRITAEITRLKINFDYYAEEDFRAQNEAQNKAKAGLLLVEALILLLGLVELAAAGRAAASVETLDEEREKYKKLLEQAGDAVIIADADTGLVTEINRMGEELTGMERGEVVGKPHDLLFPPHERAHHKAIFADIIARGGPDEANPSPKNISIVRADGTEIPVDVRCSLIAVEGHRLIQGIYRDVRARREQENLMMQQATAQMELVRQTVEALEEARDERKKAEEANRLKSEFVANMSHELRTPLTSVLGYSRIARERMDEVSAALEFIHQRGAESGATPTDMASALADIVEKTDPAGEAIAEIASFGEVVVGQGERLLHLINDLLDMSSLEAGQLTIQEHVSSARMILHSITTRLAPAADEKKIRLTTNIDALKNTDIFFLGDTSRIEQVIFNLAQNAIKYSISGEVNIAAATDDGHLLFKVKDQGIGIPARHHETIFDAFRQLDGGSTRAQGGVGLGLTLSRKLVTAMGGSINVTSAEGKGSEFTIVLPYRPVEY